MPRRRAPGRRLRRADAAEGASTGESISVRAEVGRYRLSAEALGVARQLRAAHRVPGVAGTTKKFQDLVEALVIDCRTRATVGISRQARLYPLVCCLAGTSSTVCRQRRTLTLSRRLLTSVGPLESPGPHTVTRTLPSGKTSDVVRGPVTFTSARLSSGSPAEIPGKITVRTRRSTPSLTLRRLGRRFSFRGN
jgi:hypothetical protein